MDSVRVGESTTPGAAGKRGLAARVGVASGVLVVGACVLELFLHLFPGWLPAAYRDGYPLHGIELFRPGSLAECPLEAFPLPLVPVPWDGPPPADLKEYGVAPAADEQDARRFPHIVTPADERGLPNVRALERADVVLVGDSFVLSASSTRPEGLVPLLGRSLERSVYSLGVAGIGPQQERWLLEEVGLGLQPELVLWCFFGGNDLSDAKILEERRRSGLRTRAELPTYREPPGLYLPSLFAWALEQEGPRGERMNLPLPPFVLSAPTAVENGHSTWLHPAYLVRCSIARADWEQHVAWGMTTDELRAARDATVRTGAKFVLVYLPSKSEALLPALASQSDLLQDYLEFDMPDGLPLEPLAARDLLLANRSGLREALAAFCDGEGIPFFSATDVLERQALAGEAGFLATDTHWAPEGEQLVLAALLSFLQRNDLAPR